MTRTTDRPAPSTSPAWPRGHVEYWDRVAPKYDAMYRNRWSLRENRQVAAQLPVPDLPAVPRVLDLGCGTGLGRKLVQQVVRPHQYVGLDVSAPMLRHGPGSAPAARLVQADFGHRLPVADNSFDLVLALFATGSYAPDLDRLFAEIHRVLRPAARAYVSLVSRTSLRRRAGRRAGAVELLRTRGHRDASAPPPVQTYTVAEAIASVRSAGLTFESCYGLNAFSGVLQIPGLFMVGRALAERRPALSHTFDLTVRRPAVQSEDPVRILCPSGNWAEFTTALPS